MILVEAMIFARRTADCQIALTIRAVRFAPRMLGWQRSDEAAMS